MPGDEDFHGVLLHVTFSSPIPVTPGSTYLIQIYWDTSDKVSILWVHRQDIDAYSDGVGLRPDGNPYEGDSDTDFYFKIWGYTHTPSTVPQFGAPAIIIASVSMAALLLVRSGLNQVGDSWPKN